MHGDEPPSTNANGRHHKSDTKRQQQCCRQIAGQHGVCQMRPDVAGGRKRYANNGDEWECGKGGKRPREDSPATAKSGERALFCCERTACRRAVSWRVSF